MTLLKIVLHAKYICYQVACGIPRMCAPLAALDYLLVLSRVRQLALTELAYTRKPIARPLFIRPKATPREAKSAKSAHQRYAAHILSTLLCDAELQHRSSSSPKRSFMYPKYSETRARAPCVRILHWRAGSERGAAKTTQNYAHGLFNGNIMYVDEYTGCYGFTEEHAPPPQTQTHKPLVQDLLRNPATVVVVVIVHHQIATLDIRVVDIYIVVGPSRRVRAQFRLRASIYYAHLQCYVSMREAISQLRDVAVLARASTKYICIFYLFILGRTSWDGEVTALTSRSCSEFTHHTHSR